MSLIRSIYALPPDFNQAVGPSTALPSIGKVGRSFRTGPLSMVGATGFEPAASASRTQRSSQTELRPDPSIHFPPATFPPGRSSQAEGPFGTELRPDLASHLFKRTYISSEPVPAKRLFSREPATLFKYRSRHDAETRSACSSLCTSFHGPFWRVNWPPCPSLWSNTRRDRLFV